MTQSCPGVGDDTLHSPVLALKAEDFPPFISSPTPTGLDDSQEIDIIFFEYHEPRVLAVINELQSKKKFTKVDVGVYGDVRSNEIYGVFAKENWNKH